MANIPIRVALDPWPFVSPHDITGQYGCSKLPEAVVAVLLK